MYHHESSIGISMSPPSWTFLLPHPIHLGCHRAPDLSSLHHNSKFPLVIYFTYGNVYICMLFSQLSHSPLPSLCPQVYSLRLHLHWDCCSVAKSCPTLCNPMDCRTQASLSLTISQSLPKFMSIASVMPSNHLNLCRPLLLLPSVFPSIRIFSNELTVCIRWPKYWSFSIGPSIEY